MPVWGIATLGQMGHDHAQVPGLVRLAKEALAEGKCVVIGLQSTGEARTADVISQQGEELDDFVSGPKVGGCCHPCAAAPGLVPEGRGIFDFK